ncbi:transglycosylase domain-containing protein [Sphingomonas jatrophae]|uniref:Penicillin-binding protein 1A n=1 Tax=Sphingomonas jatrophae TaxID=1166337 RepID=A0A1I6LPH0_9SPHN|nr:PBP1A family penicillin-binding protein [Sphingomonas jatrophae]SFS05308.1 penicillin-binding protein 1A [Sphingomonas jatrophae]
MAASPRPARSKARARLALAWKIALFGLVAGLVALAIAVGIAVASLPGYDELKSSPNGQMMRVHAADGTVIVSLGPSYGQWLPYDRIPGVMTEAIVAVEDRRFYSHPGIDPIGIARSTWLAFERRGTGRRLQGASTITQQLARNIFLNQSYSLGRKLREAILAMALEWKFSKREILELYLNRVYFGGGAYGIDAASRKFYGHPADRLSLGEAAIIAGLVKAPSNYSPSADAEAAVERARVVLEVMRDAGAINAAEADAARPEDVRLAPEPKQNSVRYFTDWALAQLPTLIDETTDPIEVWTTLDLNMQRAADNAIRQNTPAGLQGALVALDRDGAVRAMVGGKDYVSSIYNRATQAVRQPGSAFKLFVYLAALEAGYTPNQGVVDEPVTIDGWSPRNSSRRFSGQIDLRTAFAFSINTIAAKIGSEVGFQTVADMARRFGISTPINTHPSMVLGTSDVRLIDMTRAFAEISAKGVAVVPYGILRVTKQNGELLYEQKPDMSRVLVAPNVAAQMTDLLQTAVNTGTARAAQIGRPVAGKTGTTSSNKDGWFLGFSSGITTGVWMGRDDAKAVGGLQGGRAPARAFASFMQTAVAKRPVEAFDSEVTLPDWQLEPDEEAYYGAPDEGLVDENGLPLGGGGPAAAPEDAGAPPPDGAELPQEEEEAPPRLDRQWLDGVLRGTPEPEERDFRRERNRDRERDRRRDPQELPPNP